jgi:hypothetical protein
MSSTARIAPRRVVAVDDMDDATFAYHLAMRHPALRPRNSRGGRKTPRPTRDEHDEVHRLTPHAHYHDVADDAVE